MDYFIWQCGLFILLSDVFEHLLLDLLVYLPLLVDHYHALPLLAAVIFSLCVRTMLMLRFNLEHNGGASTHGVQGGLRVPLG